MSPSDKVLAGGVLYLTCHFICNVILSGFAGSGVAKGIIFKSTIGEISKNHTTQVTPAPFTFMIWNLIYVWLLAAYIYININLFRSRNKTDCTPPIFGRYVTLALIANAFFYTAWLFVWDNQLMTISALGLPAIAITNWIALIIFSNSLWKNVTILKTEAPKDLILHRLLVQNGLAVYTTWTTIASLVNMAVAIVYDGNIEDPAPSLIALSALAILLALWVPLELIFWDNYFRYMMTPLLVLLWALIGISVEQAKYLEETDDSVSLFTMLLSIVTVCLIVFRLLITAYRHIKRPLYIGVPTTTTEEQIDIQ